jgi:predicted DNA-binding transcriptional regulator YafY
MQLFDTIDRVHRIHKLIQREATGTADEFADRLHIRRRQLYNILEEFRDYGAEIKYSRTKCSFYYANDFDVLVKINVNPLSSQEKMNIFAGHLINNFISAILLHKHTIALPV